MINPIDQSTATQKQPTEHQFFDCIGIGARSVEYGNPQFCHSGNRYIVGSGTASGDGADGNVDFGFLQFVTSQQNGMGVVFGVVVSNFVVGGWEAGESLFVRKCCSADNKANYV